MYGLRLITAPAAQPLEPADVKQHIKVLHGSEDQYINTVLVPAAVAEAEIATHRQIITATWELTLDQFPPYGAPIVLPLGELQSVTSVKYTDSAGAEQTWSAADYDVITAKEPAEIWPGYGEEYPTTRCEPAAVRVRFVCGYGATHESVPALLKCGMLLAIGHLYMNRQAVITGTITAELPQGARHIFQRYALGDDFTVYDVARDYACTSES